MISIRQIIKQSYLMKLKQHKINYIYISVLITLSITTLYILNKYNSQTNDNSNLFCSGVGTMHMHNIKTSQQKQTLYKISRKNITPIYNPSNKLFKNILFSIDQTIKKNRK